MIRPCLNLNYGDTLRIEDCRILHLLSKKLIRLILTVSRVPSDSVGMKNWNKNFLGLHSRWQEYKYKKSWEPITCQSIIIFEIELLKKKMIIFILSVAFGATTKFREENLIGQNRTSNPKDYGDYIVAFSGYRKVLKFKNFFY